MLITTFRLHPLSWKILISKSVSWSVSASHMIAAARNQIALTDPSDYSLKRKNLPNTLARSS